MDIPRALCFIIITLKKCLGLLTSEDTAIGYMSCNKGRKGSVRWKFSSLLVSFSIPLGDSLFFYIRGNEIAPPSMKEDFTASLKNFTRLVVISI